MGVVPALVHSLPGSDQTDEIELNRVVQLAHLCQEDVSALRPLEESERVRLIGQWIGFAAP